MAFSRTATASRSAACQFSNPVDHSSMLGNEDNASPISLLPSEILAFIFETGVYMADPGSRFELMISHVPQCWRDVAFQMAQLWNTIRRTKHQQAYKPITAYIQTSSCFVLDLRLDTGTSQISTPMISNSFPPLLSSTAWDGGISPSYQTLRVPVNDSYPGLPAFLSPPFNPYLLTQTQSRGLSMTNTLWMCPRRLYSTTLFI